MTYFKAMLPFSLQLSQIYSIQRCEKGPKKKKKWAQLLLQKLQMTDTGIDFGSQGFKTNFLPSLLKTCLHLGMKQKVNEMRSALSQVRS